MKRKKGPPGSGGQKKGSRSRPGRGFRRPAPSPGASMPHRPVDFPFQEGPVPEEFVQAVADLGLFCEDVGLELPEGAEERLSRFSQRLAEANTVMNLTRVADPEGIASRHLGDSLVFCACLDGGPHRPLVLDLGTGPGLPSIPLAIARPDWRITAVDSTRKKMAFVEAMKVELGLENLRPLSERAETLAHLPEHREKYDAVVARAVARLPVLLEVTIPFLKVDGFLFAAKGSRADEEAEESSRALEELGAAIVSRETYPTMDPDTEFVMLVIQKMARTRRVYPRHPSKIKASPLFPIGV